MQQASWPLNAHIYQVFTGRWPQASLVHHQGKVFQKLAHYQWQELKTLGINTIYLLGIFKNNGPLIVPDENGVDLDSVAHRLESPFAITDHTTPNSKLGDEESLRQLINQLHKLELKVILDFVPNHTGLNHPWLKEHPEYYHQTPEGPVTEFSSDVAKLNYENDNVVAAMIGVLEAIAHKGADGVRCDMAHLVPVSFWGKAIDYIKTKHPNFCFIAEAYASDISDLSLLQSLQDAGFELIYHEPLYRNLKKVLENHEPLDYLVGHLTHTLNHNHLPWLHYLSNHDDGVIKDNDFFEAQFALIALLSGPKLWYNGVFHGRTNRLAHHYYQELKSHHLETTKLPSTIKTLLNTHQSGITITAIEHRSNLIICTLSQKGQLLLNLTLEPLTIPDTIPGTGKLHQCQAGDSLLPGQAELFTNQSQATNTHKKTAATETQASTQPEDTPAATQPANRSLKAMLDMNG